MTNHPNFHSRRAFFEGYGEKMLAGRRDLVAGFIGHTCPCCGYPLLNSRGDFEICPLCWWEDDGYDDDALGRPGDLDRLSSPNHTTLRQARQNFEEHLKSTPIEDRIIPGINDPTALRNSRRIVEAFDALLVASEAHEIMELLMVVDEALQANALALNTLLDR